MWYEKSLGVNKGTDKNGRVNKGTTNKFFSRRSTREFHFRRGPLRVAHEPVCGGRSGHFKIIEIDHNKKLLLN